MNTHLSALVIVVILSQTIAAKPVRADDTTETIKDLKKQIEQLDQKVKALERNRELEKEAAEAKAKAAPKLGLSDNGFSFRSADGNLTIALRGLLQLDSRTYFEDGGIKGNDGFVLR